MLTIVEYSKQTKNQILIENVNWREFQMKADHLYWWDLSEPSPEEYACLVEVFHFHPLAIEDCLADIHLPKVDFYEQYLYLLMHGVDADVDPKEEFIPKELDVFLSPNYLVTFHKKKSSSIQEVLRRSREDSPIFDYGLDFVLYSIIDLMVSHYIPVMDTFEEKVDDLEVRLFEDPQPELLREIFAIKRNVMQLKKTVFPQREVINHLARSDYDYIQKRTQIYFRDVYDMLYRMAEMTESFRDLTTSMVEIYLSVISNRMNEVMKVLSVFATIFMTLTVITGIYGMNFDYMPELRWKYGYFVILGVMVAVALGLFQFFRKKKWL